MESFGFNLFVCHITASCPIRKISLIPICLAELLPKYTIEYTLAQPAQIPTIFLFVVDTCLDKDDLKALRDAIVINLGLIPPYALVGLITYGNQ